MASRELIVDTIRRRPVPRIPLTEICFWPETVERWEREGLPRSCNLHELFDLDRMGIYGPDLSPRRPRRTTGGDADTVVQVDEWGRTVQSWKQATATPVNLAYGVPDVTHLAAYMEQYAGLDHRVLDQVQLQEHRQCKEAGDFTAVSPMEPAWFVIEYLLGFEEGLMAFLSHPQEVSRAMHRFMDYSLRHLRWLIDEQGLRFDALWFFADLCFKNGMLLPPAVYRELVLPLHRAYRQFCDEHGLLFMLHCDGDVREFMPLVVEAGFDVIQPLEARAGNDVRQLKPQWGDRITMMGNINADVIAGGNEEQIRHEVVSKLDAAMHHGGYIYHIDHSVPPTVSLANYSLLIRLLKEHGVYR
jgi:uroporphyrinogen decarboxylase